MRGDHHGARGSGEGLLDLAGQSQGQVVGRLVEEEQVGFGRDRHREARAGGAGRPRAVRPGWRAGPAGTSPSCRSGVRAARSSPTSASYVARALRPGRPNRTSCTSSATRRAVTTTDPTWARAGRRARRAASTCRTRSARRRAGAPPPSTSSRSTREPTGDLQVAHLHARRPRGTAAGQVGPQSQRRARLAHLLALGDRRAAARRPSCAGPGCGRRCAPLKP